MIDRGVVAAHALEFSRFLGAVKAAVEARLVTLLTERAAARASAGPEAADVLANARDLTLRGGKRYRAGMLAATYFAVASRRGPVDVGALDDTVLGGGVALELLQSYLLVQDDWMDGDVERRGGPSAHVALARSLGSAHRGECGAIMAGDYLFGLAVESLASVPAPAERVLEALKFFTRVHEDVVVGQVLDTVATNADIEVLHALKTGSYTVRGPVLLGAILGGATPADVELLSAYADPIGVAFQLRDDLIGVFGTEQEAGRPAGSDLRSAKNTAVMREAFPRLSKDDRAIVDAVWGKPDSDAAAIAAAVRVIERSGARRAVEARLFELCADAETRASRMPYAELPRALLVGGAAALRSIPKPSASEGAP
ncbi:MAG: polyprenyl synthetase family protein [Polyangiaceae bacterium]